MKTLDCQQIQYRVLRACYKMAPFSIRGGLELKEESVRANFISCLIVSNKVALLEGILLDLTLQDIPKNNFETVIVFDGPGEEIVRLVEKFKTDLDIHLDQTGEPLRVISDLRNRSVALSKGEFLLFLDDDTRLYQNDFLSRALSQFKESGCDVLIPKANALYGVVKGKYDFLDQFSFANRCSLYRRSTIRSLGGFFKGLNAYEDPELSIRLMLNAPKIVQDEGLNYYHPPLYFDSMRKPLAIGQSIFQLQGRYPWPLWLLTYFNALRFLPYGLIPGQRYRHWFKISWGVLIYPFCGRSFYY